MEQDGMEMKKKGAKDKPMEMDNMAKDKPLDDFCTSMMALEKP